MSLLIALLREKNVERSPKLKETVVAFARLLEIHNVDSPRLSAEILMAKALGIDRNTLLKRLILAPETPLAPYELALADELAERRASGEPAAYILGVKEFFGKKFFVTPATLIPRPETELLVDMSLAFVQKRALLHGGLFADFGTGSGCIAITLALEMPHWRGVALEKSPEALAVARKNADSLGTRTLQLLLADFTKPPLAQNSLDLLVANPPYVSENEFQSLSREVRCFEPKSALVPDIVSGGTSSPANGMEHAAAVIRIAQTLLRPGGRLFMEIGSAQGNELLAAIPRKHWSMAHVRKDMARLDRVLSLTRT